jgi:hypothetical protein
LDPSLDSSKQCCGSGSVESVSFCPSRIRIWNNSYGSGCRSFCQQAKSIKNIKDLNFNSEVTTWWLDILEYLCKFTYCTVSNKLKNLFFLVSWKPMTERSGSGSRSWAGSIIQSADPRIRIRLRIKCHRSGTLLQRKLKTSIKINSITLQTDINLTNLYLVTTATHAFLVISAGK